MCVGWWLINRLELTKLAYTTPPINCDKAQKVDHAHNAIQLCIWWVHALQPSLLFCSDLKLITYWEAMYLSPCTTNLMVSQNIRCFQLVYIVCCTLPINLLPINLHSSHTRTDCGTLTCVLDGPSHTFVCSGEFITCTLFLCIDSLIHKNLIMLIWLQVWIVTL